MHYRYYSTKLQVFQEYLALRRVPRLIQVGVAEKEKARWLALLQPVFYCNARCGKHSFNSSAKIAVQFECLLINPTRCKNELEPTFRFSTFLACDFKLWMHICKALRILRFGNIGENAGWRFFYLKRCIGIYFILGTKLCNLTGSLFRIFKQ